MSKYHFSKISRQRLATCHEDLQIIALEALAVSNVDFGIAEGHRPITRQKALFDKGLSKIDGITKLGKHNHDPSKAFDIYAWVGGKSSYNTATLSYLAGIIVSTAKRLYEQGKTKHLVRWGGNWDKDGEIITDQRFQDLVHFEIYKP